MNKSQQNRYHLKNGQNIEHIKLFQHGQCKQKKFVHIVKDEDKVLQVDGPYLNHKNNMDNVHKGKLVRTKNTQHVQHLMKNENGSGYSLIKTNCRRPLSKNPWL